MHIQPYLKFWMNSSNLPRYAYYFVWYIASNTVCNPGNFLKARTVSDNMLLNQKKDKNICLKLGVTIIKLCTSTHCLHWLI